MDIPASIGAMASALMAWRIAHSAALTEATRAALAAADAEMSPVTRFVLSYEALYAVRDALDDAGKTIAVQLCTFCAQHGWPGGDQRPGQIALALRRDLGEAPPPGMQWTDLADDPAPQGSGSPFAAAISSPAAPA